MIRPGLSGAERSSLDAKWAALRRTTPDRGAIDALPPTSWRYTLVYYLAHVPYATIAVVYVPYLTIKHVLRGRVWPSWTYARMLRTRLNKLWGSIVAAWPVQVDQDPYAYTRTAIAQGRYDELQAAPRQAVGGDPESGYEIRSVVLEPVRDEFRVGVGVNEHVRAERVVAFWVVPSGASGARGRADERAEAGERVVLHIHGGGYLFGHPLANHLGLEVAMASGVRVLSMSYRKPLLPHTAFPAPLLDVMAGYLHLLALGFEPRNITVLGKSAGGHLSLMLLRYIAELQLPTPGGLGMMAPWCDLTMSFPSYSRHNDFDTLCPRKLAVAVRSAMQWYTPQAMDEAYFTPAKAGARAWTWLGKEGVRVYIMFGTREMLEDELRQMVGDMKAAGAEVRVREDPNGLHTSPLIYPDSMAIFVKDMCALIDGSGGQ